MKAAFENLRERWAVKNSAALDRGHVYLLPGRNGAAFILTALLMGAFGLNYENNLVLFTAVFLLCALTTSIFLSYLNLRGLSVGAAEPPGNIYATGIIGIPLFLNPGERTERVRELRISRARPEGPATPDLIIPELAGARAAQLSCRCDRRGWFEIPMLRISSAYPLGLFRAFSYCVPDRRVLVYPKPVCCEYLLQKDAARTEDPAAPVLPSNSRGTDEIAGIRAYRPGDPLNLIDWKQLASGRGLMVKDFSAEDSMDLFLTEQSVRSADREERIGMLAYAAIDLTARGIRFGFKFENAAIPPGGGPEHRQRILRELALC